VRRVGANRGCHLRHNFAVWQGYGLFGFQLQPECSPWPPADFTIGSDRFLASATGSSQNFAD